jgi:hypothetical protein
MTTFTKVVLGGAVLIVAFDAIASVASLRFGFAYSKTAVGSWVICAMVGLLAGFTRGGLRAAVVGGALMGLVDVSLGWVVSWAIGPGRIPGGGTLSPTRWIITAVFVTLTSGGAGVAGGIVAWVVTALRR